MLTNVVVHRVTFNKNVANGAARNQVIICAGTYRKPSYSYSLASGPPDILSKHRIPIIHSSQQVGRNLSDHFALYMAFRLGDRSRGFAIGNPLWKNPSLFKGLLYDWAVSESLTSNLLSKHNLDLSFTKRSMYEILTVYVPPGIPGIPIDGSHMATSAMLLLPTSRETASLHSNSPNDPPKVRPNYLSTTLDREVLCHAARRILTAILGTYALEEYIDSETPPSGDGIPGLSPLRPDTSDEILQDRIQRTGMQHHHSVRTATMGSVADAEGRVLRVENLRVADASLIPVPLGGHPQASLYVLAEQIAAMIISEF